MNDFVYFNKGATKIKKKYAKMISQDQKISLSSPDKERPKTN